MKRGRDRPNQWQFPCTGEHPDRCRDFTQDTLHAGGQAQGIDMLVIDRQRASRQSQSFVVTITCCSFFAGPLVGIWRLGSSCQFKVFGMGGQITPGEPFGSTFVEGMTVGA